MTLPVLLANQTIFLMVLVTYLTHVRVRSLPSLHPHAKVRGPGFLFSPLFPGPAQWLEPGRYPVGDGNGTPIQYCCPENPMDGGAWWAAVHGVTKSRTRLSDFTFTFHFHALEKEMATHSRVLAWRIPGTGERGRLQSMRSHRVGHD